MTQQATHPAADTDAMSAAELLAAARDRRRAEDAAAAELLVIAAQWADLHPPESIHDAATFWTRGCEVEEQIAGDGCPLVAEFCFAELGAVLGMSTVAAKRLVGQALELRHRLPRLWSRVHAGGVPAWRARLVAEATIHAIPRLSREAAGWVDAQVAPFAATVGQAQLDRLVAEAIRRFGPPVEPEDPDDPDPVLPDGRHVHIDTDQVHYGGTFRIEGELDIPDALDLDHALRRGADELKQLGCTDSLGARRAQALGHLARHQLALDLAGEQPGEASSGPVVERDEPIDDSAESAARRPADPAAGSALVRPRLPAARRLTLHVHLTASLGGGNGGVAFEPTARLDERQRLVLLAQVKAWCADTHTDVRIQPVIDLAEEITTAGYAPTDRQRRQVELRDRTCVFPWCARPASGCDVDHVVPYDHAAAAEGRPQPGPTTSGNLGCLCRGHHRLKTHGHWRQTAIAPGTFLWTSPHGQAFLRGPGGTTPLEPPGRRP
jgi:hypothetical protein